MIFFTLICMLARSAPRILLAPKTEKVRIARRAYLLCMRGRLKVHVLSCIYSLFSRRSLCCNRMQLVRRRRSRNSKSESYPVSCRLVFHLLARLSGRAGVTCLVAIQLVSGVQASLLPPCLFLFATWSQRRYARRRC